MSRLIKFMVTLAWLGSLQLISNHKRWPDLRTATFFQNTRSVIILVAYSLLINHLINKKL